MAFALLIVYITILLVRPQEWFEPLRAFELVNVAAILTIFMTFITRLRNQALSDVLHRNTYARLVWGLLFAVALSRLARGQLQGAVDAVAEFGKSCILLFLTILLVDNPRRLLKVYWVIVIVAAMFCIHGYMQVQTGRGFGGTTPFGSFASGDFRIMGTGLFSDPNDFAMLHIVAFAFALALLQTATWGPAKLFVMIVIPGMWYVLYYTQSRGGVVGLCAMLLAYVWTSTRITIIRLFVASALLCAVVAFGPARARETVYEGSAGGRVMQWGYGNEFLKENPLFGIGYQQWLERSEHVAHNSFITCYAELGLFGYALWFSLLWLVLRSVLRISQLSALDRRTRCLATGLFAALVGYYASAFFLTRTYNPFLYLLLGLAIGMIRYVQSLPNCPPGGFNIKRRDLMWSVLISVGCIPAIWILIRLYWLTGGTTD